MHPWRTDPALADRFLPEHPDDLQVLVHDGEQRRTGRSPEGCWVRVQAVHSVVRMPVLAEDAGIPLKREHVLGVERPVYRGVLLNQPHQLRTIRQQDPLLFVHCPGAPAPLRVTEAYLAERSRWGVMPCGKCGADQAFDPMTVMAETRFPSNPTDATAMFTAFCGCGGMMTWCRIDGEPAPGDGAAPLRPWWRLW